MSEKKILSREYFAELGRKSWEVRRQKYSVEELSELQKKASAKAVAKRRELGQIKPLDNQTL